MEFLKSGRQLNCAQSNFPHIILAEHWNFKDNFPIGAKETA